MNLPNPNPPPPPPHHYTVTLIMRVKLIKRAVAAFYYPLLCCGGEMGRRRFDEVTSKVCLIHICPPPHLPSSLPVQGPQQERHHVDAPRGAVPLEAPTVVSIPKTNLTAVQRTHRNSRPPHVYICSFGLMTW